jgi:hypothetical protein
MTGAGSAAEQAAEAAKAAVEAEAAEAAEAEAPVEAEAAGRRRCRGGGCVRPLQRNWRERQSWMRRHG